MATKVKAEPKKAKKVVETITSSDVEVVETITSTDAEVVIPTLKLLKGEVIVLNGRKYDKYQNPLGVTFMDPL
jgi:hypothetical protein